MNRNRYALIAVTFALVISVMTGYYAYLHSTAMLQESEDRRAAITALLDSTEFGYVICDENKKIIEWNPAMQRLTGYTKEDIDRIGVRMVFPEPILSDEAEVFKDPTGKIRVSMVTCDLITKSGKTVPVEVVIRVVETAHEGKYFIFHVDKVETVKTFSVESEGGDKNVTSEQTD